MKRGNEKSVQRVYFALAAFNIGTLVVSLALGQQLMSVYRGAVLENETWAERLARYARLGQLVTQADAPGNDVFVDKDIAGQRKKLEVLREATVREFGAANEDLQRLSPEDRQTLQGDLTLAQTEFSTLTSEAEAIFRDYEAAKFDSAGEHMGQMDQAFARNSAALDSLRSRVQDIQSRLFEAQLATAARSQNSQYWLMGFVLLIVAAVVSYGFRLQATLRAQQEAIDRASAGMRLVLDNVEQGLLTVNLSGAVVGERSEAATRWLGNVTADQHVWDLLGHVDARAASWLQLGWPMIAEGLMPLEVVLDQLPKRMTAGKRELELSYRPINEAGQLSAVLMMLSDVTARVAAERTEQEQKQTLALFERAMKDRERLLASFKELDGLLASLQGTTDPVTARRLVHTLKGNAASMGLNAFAALCHALEDELGDAAVPTRSQLERLQTAFDSLAKWLEQMTRSGSSGLLIASEEYEAMLNAVKDERRDFGAVREIVESLQKESLGRRFEQFGEEAQRLAARLGKPGLRISSEPGGVRLDRERFGPFLGALVHVVRNAVDHGLETTEVRASKGKGAPSLRLRAQVSGGEMVLSIADDGAGIDFDALRAKARAAGHQGSDGIELLFLDGVSSKSEVTSTSGRGIGMSAVKAEVERLGGKISVHSVKGEGTTFAFSFPAQGVSVLKGTAPALELLRAS